MAPQTSEELSALCERAFAQAAKLQSLGRGRMEAALDRGQLEITADLLHQLAKHAAYREVASEATSPEACDDLGPLNPPDEHGWQTFRDTGAPKGPGKPEGYSAAAPEQSAAARREALAETARQVPVVSKLEPKVAEAVAIAEQLDSDLDTAINRSDYSTVRKAVEAARAEGHKAGRAQGHREAAELLREDAANRYEVVKTLGRTADILERGGEGAG